MSQRFVDEAPPRDLLRALGKIDVVRDDDVGAHVGVQVIIGTPEHPALDASTITVVNAQDATVPEPD
jgi:hypothetical protein